MEYKLLIERYRLMRGMTQEQLARKAKVKQSYISQLEQQQTKKSPTVRILMRLSKALEICPHMLVEYDMKCGYDCKTNCPKR